MLPIVLPMWLVGMLSVDIAPLSTSWAISNMFIYSCLYSVSNICSCGEFIDASKDWHRLYVVVLVYRNNICSCGEFIDASKHWYRYNNICSCGDFIDASKHWYRYNNICSCGEFISASKHWHRLLYIVVYYRVSKHSFY